MGLKQDIAGFLKSHGIVHRMEMIANIEVIIATCISSDKKESERIILPVEIKANDIAQARSQQFLLKQTIDSISRQNGTYPLIITEDRWKTQKGMMQDRLLSHLEIFFPVYARNCEVRRIDKAEAAEFLNRNHSYGDATCRYRYGLFLKRHTGHLSTSEQALGFLPGTLIAVATFSNARKWIKGDKVIRSFEWTRYASLPDIRVNGGMGKLLKHFINDVDADDIMTYSDLEWSEGKVYEQLGFTPEGEKAPVLFGIEETKERIPIKQGTATSSDGRGANEKFFYNFGSRKYRLKLTEYD